MLARRKLRSRELAERIRITEQNLPLRNRGKVRGARFVTLSRVCEMLQCQAGDLLAWRAGPDQRAARSDPAGASGAAGTA